ncbi:hypothetical protein ACFWC9_38505 [Streptomyces goshikiensis]
MAAGIAFKQVWKLIGYEDDAPTPPTRTAPGRRS